jgi:hypothetical protein
MAAKDSVLAMLAQNIPASQVAATLGVSDGYVSQLLSQEDFAQELEAVKVAVTQKDLDYDEKLDRTEEAFLDRIEEKSRFANLQQSMQAFRTLNGAKRRRDSKMHVPTAQIAEVINIVVAVCAIPDYKMNRQNEIIEVEGKTMVSATPTRLEEILASRNGGQSVEKPQLPGITKVERAAGVLQTIENRPQRKPVKQIPNLVDLL